MTRQHGKKNTGDDPDGVATDSTSVTPPDTAGTLHRAPSHLNSASTKTTTAFVRRTLCAHHLQGAAFASGDVGRAESRRIEDLLPPLTSSNEVDLQLYGFIAVLIKDLVHPWYTRFTSDHIFDDEVIQIIAHCTRALEQRLRNVDLELLCLDEFPRLLDAHLEAFHVALKASTAAPTSTPSRTIYHSIRPHPALYPVPLDDEAASCQEQQKNEAAYRHLLAQGLLAVLLPTEDLQNPCLRALISESLGDLILGNFVGGKLCESAFIFESISKGAEVIRTRLGITSWISDPQHDQGQTGHPGDTHEDQKIHEMRNPGSSVAKVFWSGVQYLLVAATAIRLLLAALTASANAPTRSTSLTSVGGPSDPPSPSRVQARSGSKPMLPTQPSPVMTYEAWPVIARFANMPSRMPWACGFISLAYWLCIHGPGQVGGTNGRLDRLLADRIHSVFKDSTLLPGILFNLRTTLFPGNVLPRSTAQSSSLSAEQAARARRTAAVSILNCIPQPLASIYFGVASGKPRAVETKVQKDDSSGLSGTETMINGVEDMLRVFEDQYMNKHLMYTVLECVIAKVVPEMADGGSSGSSGVSEDGKGVKELLEERGITANGDA